MGPIQSLTAVLLLLLGLCAGQRMVTVQKGPLYRARGYHVTIWCNVSGYRGPSEQTFQWSVYPSSAPEREMQLISTGDSSFPYAYYAQRVRAGEVYVERIQGDSVLLHITKLLDQDAGKYECYTPNTEVLYFGSYSAQTSLTVISDTLSATMKPQDFIQVEGDSLELVCEVSTATAQHTHISVAWYLVQGDGEDQEILSLSRDFVLIAGSSYNQRVSSGDIRLDKIGDKKYKLTIVKVLPSDQGKVYCEAVEWIQDPDGTWKDITRKQTNKTSLTVRSLDNNISVTISVDKSSVLEGEVLHINCSVQAQNIQNRWFQMVWLHRERVAASIDPHGALAFPEDNGDRYTMGNLLVRKQSNEKYILRINQAELNDKGTYRCEVSEMERSSIGSLAVKKKMSSSGTDIDVSPRGSQLKLILWVNEERIMEGEALTFHCNAGVAENSLSVKWWYISKNKSPPMLIANMDRDGMLRIGTSYLERSTHGDLRLEKVNSSTFTLTIYNTSATEDSGLYRCEVTEWFKSRSWQHTQEISATVESLGMNLKAVLISRVANVKLHEDFELHCRLSVNRSTNRVPISVIWQFHPSSAQTGYQQVVKISAGGTVEWGSALLHFQKKTKITKSPSLSQLLIHSATWQEAGIYKCEVEVWRNSQQARDSGIAAAAVVSSNPVEIKVTQPESKLRVSQEIKLLEISTNDATEIKCEIISWSKVESQLGVSWYFQPLSPVGAVPQLILVTNYSSIVEYGEAFSSPQKKSRFHSEKVSSHLYQLSVSSVDYDVSGTYYCVVEEWKWSEDSGWYNLGKMESGRTTVKFKPSEKKLHIENTNHSITVPGNEDVTLTCLLQSQISPTSRFSISWFKDSIHSSTETLLKIKDNGIIEYGNGNMARRLRPHCPSTGDFHLTIQDVEVGDSGLFYCRVEEWDVNCSTAQVQQASVQSGYSELVVLPPVSTDSTEICSSAPLFHLLLFYPLAMFLILMTGILFLCFKIKLIRQKPQNLKTKQGLWGETGLVEPDHLQVSGERSFLEADAVEVRNIVDKIRIKLFVIPARNIPGHHLDISNRAL
uniref:immunoglobulin superfamily member 2 n=1 Tax=Euleptes europaea TaxID=460621 RepID=UPI002540010D|nr:immunoglobulin superfamily member 2 [Euleptes europaea]